MNEGRETQLESVHVKLERGDIGEALSFLRMEPQGNYIFFDEGKNSYEISPSDGPEGKPSTYSGKFQVIDILPGLTEDSVRYIVRALPEQSK